jgi:phosphatidylserine decarboxylase
LEVVGQSNGQTPLAVLKGQFVLVRVQYFAPANGSSFKGTLVISGDTWNVNPIALKRVEKLFCKNERAFLKTRITGVGPAAGQMVALVPVAAILVASIRLHFLDVLLHLKYPGPAVIPCHASFNKGQEMGWCQHGSTIIVLAPKGFVLSADVATGAGIRMGQALMRWAG